MKKVLLLLILICIMCVGCSLKFEFPIGTGLNITKENYNKINYGDSYSTIKFILGGECEKYYSNDNEDWYTCIDDQDSFKRIVLKIVDGKLESKSSFGLN